MNERTWSSKVQAQRPERVFIAFIHKIYMSCIWAERYIATMISRDIFHDGVRVTAIDTNSPPIACLLHNSAIIYSFFVRITDFALRNHQANQVCNLSTEYLSTNRQ